MQLKSCKKGPKMQKNNGKTYEGDAHCRFLKNALEGSPSLP